MDDFAVVGGGIGGASTAVMLSSKYTTTLYEKEPYLGGCSSTFKHKKHWYNAGATTFSGFDKGTILHDFFTEYQIDFKHKKLTNALTVIQNNKTITRYQNFEAFLDQIQNAHYHPKNREFYQLVYEINQVFYQFKSFSYTNENWYKKLLSLSSFSPLLVRYYPYIFQNASKFLNRFFGDVSKEYIDFMNNQSLIVTQATTKEINFFTLALALGYHFQTNLYVYGGMGALFKGMEPHIHLVKKNQFIQKIEQTSEGYMLHSQKHTFRAKNIVLNSTIFNSDLLDIKSHPLKKYQHLDSAKSAFVVYLTIDSNKHFNHHYQIIEKEVLPYTISNSLFVSFGASDDPLMCKSVTISIHTLTPFWKDDYEKRKAHLQHVMIEIVKKRLHLTDAEIKEAFSATPLTFKRYINRSSLGGIPATQNNLFYKLPANITPIKGLYLVGDTSFAAQGWMGVMMGVWNLKKALL
jgi:phytoene dehydrogenase-like protein